MHAFDNDGIDVDANRSYNPEWLSNTTREHYKNFAQCVSDHYSNYTVNDEPINGARVLGEAIADITGLNAAFNAYKKLSVDQTKPSPLPIRNLSPDQLFFLSFAQSWCGTYTNEHLHYQLLTNEHPPNRYRVHGPLSNSEEFAAAFNCEKNTQMNPQNKCQVW